MDASLKEAMGIFDKYVKDKTWPPWVRYGGMLRSQVDTGDVSKEDYDRLSELGWCPVDDNNGTSFVWALIDQ